VGDLIRFDKRRGTDRSRTAVAAAVAVIVTAVACGPSIWDEAAAARNDEPVYQAVIDSVIRPELRRLFRVESNTAEPPLVVTNRTLPIGEIGELYLERPPRPGTQPTFAELLSARARQRLERMLRDRNRSETSISLHATASIVLVSQNELFDRSKLDWSRLGGWSHFSRPGYAGRHAIVYATYSCGGLCGHGWLVLLEQQQQSWRVLAHDLMWVS
jgi:hypothetical protein